MLLAFITFDRLVLTFLTNHIFSYITMPYTGVYEETFNVNSQIAQTTKIV